MNKKTLKALKGSIKKWEGIIAGNEIDAGPANCPLCEEFWVPVEIGRVTCKGCPVAEKSGAVGCNNTPYEEWDSHHDYPEDDEEHDGRTVCCPKCEDLAKREVEFLKSLLPEGEV